MTLPWQHLFLFFMHDFHLILLIYLLSVNMETYFLVIVRNIASADNSWRGRAVVLHVELHLSILFQILLPSRVFGVRKLWQLPFCRNWWAALWITFFWQLGFNTKALNMPGFTSMFKLHCLPGRKVFHVNSDNVLCSNVDTMFD